MIITVIEPHADDAFLSAHGHIQQWLKQGHDVRIMTVERDARRLAEGERYAEKVGAKYVTDPVGQLVLPLGINHRDHVAARRQFETAESWFYLDMHYALVQRNAELVTRLMQGMEIVSFMKPHARKWTLRTIFESQSSYFSFRGRGEQLKKSSFELIMRKAGASAAAPASGLTGGRP